MSEKILFIFSVQEKLQVLELFGCRLSSEVTKDLMHILVEHLSGTIEKVNLHASANMDSDEACHSLVELADKSLSLKKVDLRHQIVKRKIGVYLVYANREIKTGIITCVTLKKGDYNYKESKYKISIDTVLFQRETKRTNRHIVVVDSSG